jgi:serine/threonine-protein kinase RsbT
MTGDADEWWLHEEVDLTIAASELRRRLRDAGWSAPQAARPITVFMELGRNILKYARAGRLRVWGLPGRCLGLEAVDHGPGIANPAAAMTDHFSTGGSLGLGLPGVKRLCETFELHTTLGVGTRVRVTMWAR